MDKKIARQLVDIVMSLGEPMNRATALSLEISDPEEQVYVRRVVGETTNRLYVDLMLPIIRQYPDLDPDNSA